jgi:hypothetical protein
MDWSGRRVVPADFLGVHAVGVLTNHGLSTTYAGGADEPADYKVGNHRTYGALNANQVWNAKGAAFDWTLFDAAFQKYRKSGRAFSAIYTPFNFPPFMQTIPAGGGDWAMSLPTDRAEYERFILALFQRYPEFKILEVANEALCPGVQDPRSSRPQDRSFWRGSYSELATFCDWNLDLRQKIQSATGRRVEIWCFSIPGFFDNIVPTNSALDPKGGLRNFLTGYARRGEFDAFPIHLYYGEEPSVGNAASAANAWTCWKECRAMLDGLGLQAKPIADNEHGLGPKATPEMIYRTSVFEAVVMGLRCLTWFSTSQILKDEAYIGEPFRNAATRGALEAASAALDGRTITRVVEDPTHKYGIRIEYADSTTPIPVPPVTPPVPAPTTGLTESQVREIIAQEVYVMRKAIVAEFMAALPHLIASETSGRKVTLRVEGTLE